MFPFLFFPYQKHYPEFPPLLLHRERGTDKDVLVKTLRRLNSSLRTSKAFHHDNHHSSRGRLACQRRDSPTESVQSFFNLFFIVSLLSKQPKASVSLTLLFPRSHQSHRCFRQSLAPYQESRSVCRSTQIGDRHLFFYLQATTEIQKGNTRRCIHIAALNTCVSLFSSSCLSRGNSLKMYRNLLHLITPQHYLQPTLAYKSIPCLHSQPSNIFNQRPTLPTITDTCTHPRSRSMGTSAAWLQ